MRAPRHISFFSPTAGDTQILEMMSSDKSQNRYFTRRHFSAFYAASSPEWCVLVTITQTTSGEAASSSLDKIRTFFLTPVVAESDEV